MTAIPLKAETLKEIEKLAKGKKEYVVIGRKELDSLLGYVEQPTESMTKEEALSILMAEIKKGEDAGDRYGWQPFEDFVKELGLK
ncbi:MAG: hypothetical protein FWB72_07420 [Firmicutes bacterium]|nr:hypothetical protein [Bacillota bacterium]